MTHVFKHTPNDDDDGGDDRVVTEPTDLKFVGPSTAAVVDAAEFSAQDVADKRISFRMLVDAGVNPGVAAKIRRCHSLSWSFESGDDLSRRSEQIRGLQDEERAWVASSYDDSDDDEDAPAGDDSASPGGSDGNQWASSATTNDDDAVAADAEDDGEAADGTATGADRFAAEASWVASSSLADGDDAASADGSGDPVAAEAAWRDRSKPTPLTELSGIGESYASKLADAGVTSVRSLATADPNLLADVTGLSKGKVATWYAEANEQAD